MTIRPAPAHRGLTVLLCAVAAIAVAALMPATADARFGAKTLRKGMHGKDVRTLQRYLRRAGYHTSVDGEFGNDTRRRVRAFEGNEELKVDGVVSRSDAAKLKSVARQASANGGSGEGDTDGQAPGDTQTVPGDTAELTDAGYAIPPAGAPAEVQAVIRAGNDIAKKPYSYGGGHGEKLQASGYDCSGSMSYALRKAGLLDESLTSGGFARFGQRGRGEWITIRANGGHSYMMVAGLRFDTSAAKRSETRSRWTDEMRSARGYRGRHPEGL